MEPTVTLPGHDEIREEILMLLGPSAGAAADGIPLESEGTLAVEARDAQLLADALAHLPRTLMLGELHRAVAAALGRCESDAAKGQTPESVAAFLVR